MRAAILSVLVAAAGLGGCATVHGADIGGMSWALHEVPDGRVRLTLGIPDSDDLFLLAACTPRSGRIDMVVVAHPDDGAIVDLVSGRLHNRYAAAGVVDEVMIGAVDLQFALNADDPVLRRAADTGELAVTVGRTHTVTPNAFASLHDLVAACRR